MANDADAIDLMREVDTLRRALVEAGRCVECGGRGRVCVSVACVECGATGIRADLSPETRAAVARAKEALDG
jgi:RecJ-like exonuclease